MKEADLIIASLPEFLKFLKSRFTLIHASNFFFRDFHYGVMSYLHERKVKLTYQEAEEAARKVGEALEQKGIFTRVDHQSWRLNYPEFALPRVEKAPAAAPAAPAAAAAKPAAPAAPAPAATVEQKAS
jgi:hypothetical protein